MKQDITNFIQKCRACQLKKLTRTKTKQPLIITDTPEAGFDKISLDIVGPLPMTQKGNTHVLTVQDLLTKYSLAIPLKETNSLAVADAFIQNFICICGAPEALLTDQGSNFLTSLIRNIARKFKIKHYKTTADHPQSQGSIERLHHILIEYLKTQIADETNWDEHLNLAMYSYNSSIHESTQYSLFQLVYGRIPRMPSSQYLIEEDIEPTYKEYLETLFNKLESTQAKARSNLIKSKERNKKYYDKRIHPTTLEEGTYAFLLKEPKKGKFAYQYTGPYEIIEVLPNSNVILQFRNSTRIVHADQLKISHIETG